ncbi:uncharacterized protein RHIMIDRAFT_237976 [Rhizopus microsporus ATCC 52813]|uniref:Uncharacterized protein n=1 Tax=Rhizopus microsporus ATCC 52813 TaxID=1340429 RepID=A0A2G4STR9_RHIZD|nr:uncharacterized protein RHIMIDRAFT_237976 [Rhizopus microsporus ATCC 52813]PHZ12160.1 hypothetical protein RHIMIDRAFT_237976 [Rhizopus microsporus ATCC 52813]
MRWPFGAKEKEQDTNHNTSRDSRTFLLQKQTNTSTVQIREEEVVEYKYAPKQQDEEQPMDLGTLQDIFSFSFMRGRPILNFILAILWSVGLPVLLYNIFKPHTGQVLAMVIASAPPLAIVIIRMIKDHTFDPLGCVAGISFLISGILSIAQPDEKVSAICESIVPFTLGTACIISVIPIKIGSFELKLLVYQIANQIMPRAEVDEDLKKQDIHRLTNQSGQKKLDYLYTHMAKFRQDMRYMTFTWGFLLILSSIVKIIIVLTSSSLTKAQIYGYILFGLTTFFMMFFTWFYTKIIKGHVLSQVAFWKEKKEQEEMDKKVETAYNAEWGVNTMSNAYGQVIGFI